MGLAIIGFLSAVLLSHRFAVLSLIPAILLSWIVALVYGLASGGNGLSILLMMILIAGAIQLGYIVGIALQWASRTPHASSQPGRSKKTAIGV